MDKKSFYELPDCLKNNLLGELKNIAIFILISIVMVNMMDFQRNWIIAIVVLIGASIWIMYSKYLNFVYGKYKTIQGKCIAIENIKGVSKVVAPVYERKVTIKTDDDKIYVLNTTATDISYNDEISVYLLSDSNKNIVENGKTYLYSYYCYDIIKHDSSETEGLLEEKQKKNEKKKNMIRRFLK